jgi:CheY-like chemotaxis protein
LYSRNVVNVKEEKMKPAHVLIIDDDPDFVEITQSLLETRQYKVSCACNMDEGFTRLEESIPDVIILDILMGKGAEGFIFARKIRKDSRFAKIPIVMLTSMREQTGFEFPGERMHPIFLPVDAYMEKPFESQALFDEIERLLCTSGR